MGNIEPIAALRFMAKSSKYPDALGGGHDGLNQYHALLYLPREQDWPYSFPPRYLYTTEKSRPLHLSSASACE